MKKDVKQFALIAVLIVIGAALASLHSAPLRIAGIILVVMGAVFYWAVTHFLG